VIGFHYLPINVISRSVLLAPDLYEYLNVPYTIGPFKLKS